MAVAAKVKSASGKEQVSLPNREGQTKRGGRERWRKACTEEKHCVAARGKLINCLKAEMLANWIA